MRAGIRASMAFLGILDRRFDRCAGEDRWLAFCRGGSSCYRAELHMLSAVIGRGFKIGISGSAEKGEVAIA